MPNDPTLPDDLSIPKDDGAADHLSETLVPALPPTATDGQAIDLSAHADAVVVYAFPKTGRPNEDVMPDGWTEIPGAQGCTPEACGLRDQYEALLAAGATAVFGLSLQLTAYQREVRDRLGLPFEFLSDADSELPRRSISRLSQSMVSPS